MNVRHAGRNGAIGLGAYNHHLGAWYDYLFYSPGKTAYKVYRGALTKSEVQAEDDAAGKITAGYYMEPGPWVYRYDTSTKNVTLVMSPTSTTPKQVANGSTAYDAIVAVIQNGKAKRISAVKVKKLRGKAHATPSASSRLSTVTTDIQIGPSAVAEAKQSGGTGTALDAIPTWWLWVMGAGVAVSVLGILFIPSPSRVKRAPSHGVPDGGVIYDTTATAAV